MLDEQQLPNYDYTWKSEQSGTKDNYWWLLYRRWAIANGIIKEIHFKVTPIYLD